MAEIEKNVCFSRSSDQPSAVALKNDASLFSDSKLFSLPTEILCNIVTYLTAYEKLTVRITCKRLYSLLSDPIAWSTLIWRDCRKGEKELKALRLALKLSHSSVHSVVISYPDSGSPPISKFIPHIHNCKCIRYLTLLGINITLEALKGLFSALTSLYSFSVTIGIEDEFSCQAVLKIAAKAVTLQILTLCKGISLAQVLRAWKECGYRPPDLRLKGFNSSCLQDYRLRSLSLKSVHPARLALYPSSLPVVGSTFSKYPLLELSLCPSLEFVSCSSKSLCLQSTVLCLYKSKTDADQYVSASSFLNSRHITLNDTTVPLLPSSIRSLYLAGLEVLSSTQLTVISESCPNLVCLDISFCYDVLVKLEGLADISSKCLRLASVNLMGISNVEGVAILWEILAGMKRLRHLALSDALLTPDRKSTREKCVSQMQTFSEESLTCIRRSVARTNLVVFESCLQPYPSCAMFDLYLPAFHFLKHLRILKNWVPGSSSIHFSEILPHLPHLTYLYIDGCSFCDPDHISFPTDPTCYQSLRQLVISYPRFHMSEELIQALVHHRALTHVYLYTEVSVPSLRKLIESSPQLCEFRVTVVNKREIDPRLWQELETILTSCGVVWTLDFQSERKLGLGSTMLFSFCDSVWDCE